MTVVNSETNLTDKILSPLIKDDKTRNANITKKGKNNNHNIKICKN